MESSGNAELLEGKWQRPALPRYQPEEVAKELASFGDDLRGSRHAFLNINVLGEHGVNGETENPCRSNVLLANVTENASCVEEIHVHAKDGRPEQLAVSHIQVLVFRQTARKVPVKNPQVDLLQRLLAHWLQLARRGFAREQVLEAHARHLCQDLSPDTNRGPRTFPSAHDVKVRMHSWRCNHDKRVARGDEEWQEGDSEFPRGAVSLRR